MEDKREQCIMKTDSQYPQGLRDIGHGPEKIYVRGRLPDDNIPSAAIIGARKCSSYGREMAEWFAGELAAAGIQVISGMAAGIDGVAQRAALTAGGSSFGVLGSGTDICYPRDNADLYAMLLEQGGVLSEHPAGTPPLPNHFPSRNRIISALSDVILVIEARERSGTLITVDFALEQGKDVYVLPGRVTDGLSCGCNRLLRQGAGIALEPNDIVDVLQEKYELCRTVKGAEKFFEDRRHASKAAWESASADCIEAISDRQPIVCQAGERERLVWEWMGDRPFTLQQLYEKIRSSKAGRNMKLQEVMDILVNFVMRDMIIQEYGNQYERKRNITLCSKGKARTELLRRFFYIK